MGQLHLQRSLAIMALLQCIGLQEKSCHNGTTSM